MRARILLGAAIATGLFWCLGVAAQEAEESETGRAAVEGALVEPADPDDEADIESDNDPNDVGQVGLEPSEDRLPADPPGSSGERD